MRARTKWWSMPSGIAVGICVVCMAVAVGCGGDEEGSGDSAAGATATEQTAQDSSAVEAAQQLVDEASGEIAWEPPGPAISPGDEVRGKTVYLIANTLNIPFWQSAMKGMEEAGALFDIKIVGADAQGQASVAARQVEQAIGRKAAAIVIGSIPTDAIAGPIQAASDAGIPVIQMFEEEGGPPTDAQKGIYGNVSTCDSCSGRMLAALAVVQSAGDVNAVVVSSPDIGSARREAEGFETGLKEFCPDCKVEVQEVPSAQWQTELAPAASSIVNKKDVNYLVPVFQHMFGFMKPSIIAAQAEERVKVLTANAIVDGLKDLQKGEIIAGVVGQPDIWVGWAAMDDVLRALSGEPPHEQSNVPNKLFTADNIQDVDLEADQEEWFGLDFRSEFKKLWGAE